MKKLMRVEFVVIVLLVIGFIGVVGAQNGGDEIEINEATKEYNIGGKRYNLNPYDELSSITVSGAQIIEGSFEAGKADEYPLGDQKVKLPVGAKAKFEGGKWKITMPEEGIVEPSQGTSGKTEIEYTPSSGDILKIRDGNNKLHELNVDGNLKLKSQNGKFFFEGKGRAKLDSMSIINLGELQADKIYIDFDGKINENYDSAYISYSNDEGVFVTGSNIDRRGPKVAFDRNNPFGIELQNNDHMAVWSLGNKDGSYVKIQNRNRFGENKIPHMETLNQFAVDFDSKGIHYQSETGKLYLKARGGLITGNDGFETSQSSAPVEIASFKGTVETKNPISTSSTGGKSNLNMLLIGDEPIFAYGNNPGYWKTDTLYDASNLLQGLSNSRLFYNMNDNKDFSGFLNGKVTLFKHSGTLDLTPEKRRKMADFFAGMPEKFWEKTGFNINNPLKIEGKILSRGIAGEASHYGGKGVIQLDSNSFDVFVHEVGHIQVFFEGDESFRKEWKRVHGGQSVTKYGGKNHDEDIAETYMQVYNGDLGDAKRNKHVLAKVALFRKYQFISEGDFIRLGLEENKVNDYVAMR